MVKVNISLNQEMRFAYDPFKTHQMPLRPSPSWTRWPIWPERIPLNFHLESLADDKRASRVLESVALNSNWGKPLPKGWGRGIAQHHNFVTTIAEVAEVSVDAKSGRIQIHRVDVAVDCGPVVNPDPLETQIQGAVAL